MDGISFAQFIVILGVAFPIIWIYTIVDLLRTERKDKIIWLLVLIFLNLLGVVLYWIFRPRKNDPPEVPPASGST